MQSLKKGKAPLIAGLFVLGFGFGFFRGCIRSRRERFRSFFLFGTFHYFRGRLH
jgi:hypothetical protein